MKKWAELLSLKPLTATISTTDFCSLHTQNYQNNMEKVKSNLIHP